MTFLIPALAGQLGLMEAAFYLMGLQPSRFMFALGDLPAMRTTILCMGLMTIFVSIQSGLLTWTRSRIAIGCQREMTERLVRPISLENSTPDPEQRILEDCKTVASMKVDLLKRMLSPLMALFYTFKLLEMSENASFWIILSIYVYFGVCFIILKRLSEWYKGATADVSLREGLFKKTLCWTSHNWEPILMTRGALWMEDKLINRLSEVMEALTIQAHALSVLESGKTFVSYFGAVLNYLVILSLYLTLQDPSSLTPAEIAKLSFIVLMIIAKLDEVAGCADIYGKYRASMDRITQLEASRGALQRNTFEPKELKFEQVAVPNYSRFSVSLPPTGNVWIQGKSGCGKTSLLTRVMSGILVPTTDSVVIGSEQVMIIPQGPFIIDIPNSDANIYDLITYPSYNTKSVEYLLDCVKLSGLDNLARTMAKGPWSPGEWQRIHVARCFYHRPRVVLLDEPFSQLDYSAAISLYHALTSNIARVIIISHTTMEADNHDYHLLSIDPPDQVYARLRDDR